MNRFALHGSPFFSGFALFFLSSFLLLPAAETPPASPAFEVESTHGALAKLSLLGNDIPLVSGRGGFTLVDFKAKKELELSKGTVTQNGNATRFAAQGDDVSLSATFTPAGDGTLQVTGEIAEARPDDRAILVRYVVPVPKDDAVFQNDLSQSVKIDAATKALGTIFPIAATTGPDWGISLSIPPTHPCCFGMIGNTGGLGLEFYLGVTPKTNAFPQRARFAFVIDSALPGWGFRSALNRYYQRYPDFYHPRLTGAGFWNWNDPAEIDQPTSFVDDAMKLYRVHGTPHTATFAAQVARDNRDGVLTFDYQIVGMRELVNLPTLPANYDAAMDTFHQFSQQWYEQGPGGPLQKKYINPNGRNQDLPHLVDQCVVNDADGHYRLRIRSSAWGANSVTFTMNPNPDLFKDKGIPTVGSTTLDVVGKWFATEPSGGVHMDSLGYQWPACLNYREDHFPYARYPLTFDKDGRIALHNMISHYEFLEDMRALAIKNNKFVFGNGIDIYENDEMQEHYNSLKNGRFFLAAQIDAAGREIEDDVPDRERLDAFRTCMGPKLMTEVLYKWTDPDMVKLEMNRALVYDIFAAPNRWVGDKVSYLTAPNGYARDKSLLEWFSEKARLLHDAGWQPITYAQANSPDVAVERYGSGDVFYFALINLGSGPVDCQLDVDMKALHLSPRSGVMSAFTEVANQTSIKAMTEGNVGHVRLLLQPNRAQIIKLARMW